MIKVLAVALVAAFGLTACDSFTNSPEQKAFEKFVAGCKANPSTPACVEYAKTRQGDN